MAVLFAVILLPSCSDDFPEERSAEDVIGIYSDREGHYLEFADPDHMYEYLYQKTDRYEYWLKRSEAYFYEPHSQLMAKENFDGMLQLFRVMDVNSSGIELCWVEDPELNGLEGDAKYELIKKFVKNEYDYDASNTEIFRRVSAEDLKKAIGDVEVIVP